MNLLVNRWLFVYSCVSVHHVDVWWHVEVRCVAVIRIFDVISENLAVRLV